MKSIIFIVTLFATPHFGLATSPMLKGAVGIGGSAALPLKWDTFGNFFASVDVSPGGSYFLSDNWELMGAIRI